MTIALVLLGIALAISLAFNLGLVGGGATGATASSAPSSSSAAARSEARGDDDRARKAELDLEKKKKELEDLKKAQHELKDELKAIKKKLHEHREAHKTGDDLAKERAEVERHASTQLDATRAELATALAEVARLKSDAETKGKKRAAAPTEEKKDEPKVEKPQEVVTRVIRELSDVEKERIAKLEAQSATDRKKANELDRELKSLKAKFDRHQRDSKRVYADADLARDKFRAVEVRLNRTLLENDLLKRAIKDLEKKSGQHAERLELTPEELAEGDKTMKARHSAEDAAEAEARAKLEAAPATHPEGDEPAAAEASTEAAPAATPAPAAQA